MLLLATLLLMRVKYDTDHEDLIPEEIQVKHKWDSDN